MSFCARVTEWPVAGKREVAVEQNGVKLGTGGGGGGFLENFF